MPKALAGHTHEIIKIGPVTTVKIYKPDGITLLETKVARAPWMAYRLRRRAEILGSTLKP